MLLLAFQGKNIFGLFIQLFDYDFNSHVLSNDHSWFDLSYI
jgi:hypothetical protein